MGKMANEKNDIITKEQYDAAILRITVAGRTNKGKTAWLCGIPYVDANQKVPWRNEGKIQDSLDTTREWHEDFAVWEKHSVGISDLEGLNFSPALNDHLDKFPKNHTLDNDGRDLIENLEQICTQEPKYKPDLSIIKRLVDKSLLFIIMDGRDHDDISQGVSDLRLLKRLGKPIIVILNHSQHLDDEVENKWQKQISKLTNVPVICYDAFKRQPNADEKILNAFEKVFLLKDNKTRKECEIAKSFWIWVIDKRKEDLKNACDMVAEFLVNLAAYKIVEKVQDKSLSGTKNAMAEELSDTIKNKYKEVLKNISVTFNILDYYIYKILPLEEDFLKGVKIRVGTCKGRFSEARYEYRDINEQFNSETNYMPKSSILKSFRKTKNEISEVVSSNLRSAFLQITSVQKRLALILVFVGILMFGLIFLCSYFTNSPAETQDKSGSGYFFVSFIFILVLMIAVGIFKYSYKKKLYKVWVQVTDEDLGRIAKELIGFIDILRYRGAANNEQITREEIYSSAIINQYERQFEIIYKQMKVARKNYRKWCLWTNIDAESVTNRKKRRESIKKELLVFFDSEHSRIWSRLTKLIKRFVSDFAFTLKSGD